jgi:hypothetical protein
MCTLVQVCVAVRSGAHRKLFCDRVPLARCDEKDKSQENRKSQNRNSQNFQKSVVKERN